MKARKKPREPQPSGEQGEARPRRKLTPRDYHMTSAELRSCARQLRACGASCPELDLLSEIVEQQKLAAERINVPSALSLEWKGIELTCRVNFQSPTEYRRFTLLIGTKLPFACVHSPSFTRTAGAKIKFLSDESRAAQAEPESGEESAPPTAPPQLPASIILFEELMEFNTIEMLSGALLTLADYADFLADYPPEPLSDKQREVLLLLGVAIANGENAVCSLRTAARVWRSGPLGKKPSTRERAVSDVAQELQGMGLVRSKKGVGTCLTPLGYEQTKAIRK